MKPKPAKIKITARETKGFLFEKYEYSSGTVEPLPAQSHPEYQFGICLDTNGKYDYRGSRFVIPQMTVSVLHSGEKHAPDDTRFINQAGRFQMLYAPPVEMLAAAREIGWRKNELPFFAECFIADRILPAKYLQLFRFEQEKTSLFEDIAKLDFLSYLIKNHAQNKIAVSFFKAHPAAVRLAREYLDAHFARAVSLDELSKIVRAGKFYLCRAFRQSVGVSPHVYQNQLRLNHAKKMLVRGDSITETALRLGFFDHSHFGKNFKRLIGISPQAYAGGAIFS